MDKIKTYKEKRMREAYASLAEVISSYEPDRLDEKTVDSLRFMLKHDTFAPIRQVIIDKLIDIGEYFRKRDERIIKTTLDGKPIKPKNIPKNDNRKRKKKQANAGDVPSGSTPGPTMDFRVDPDTGILLPVKK
jgi:hypothetical protein